MKTLSKKKQKKEPKTGMKFMTASVNVKKEVIKKAHVHNASKN